MSETVPFTGETQKPADGEKITILPGHAPNYSAATFCIKDEDHTLGNALRWMVMKDPDVEYCGYSLPHPSEPKIHIRIQMYSSLSAIACLFRAMQNLRELFGTVGEAYAASLRDDDYIRENDTDIKAAVAEVVRQGDAKRERAKIEKESVMIEDD